MQQQLLDMLDLQDKMNRKVHPDWKSQNYAWYRAIWTECAELMDHYGWKWWKAPNPDIEQIKLEIVDIWHFAMSILISESDNVETIAARIEEQWTEEPETREFREAIEMLALNTLQTKSISIPLFCQLLALSDMNLNELYSKYIGKNVLNFFRQDHGYKEGSYVKEWDGKEDNEHLAEILTSLDVRDSEFKDNLYQSLEERYPA